MTASTDGPALVPVTVSERLASVDIVRGFALWGVLLINMMNFGALDTDRWTGPLDRFAFWAQRFFFEQKSWRLFSLLFGFGFAIQFIRASERGARFLPLYVRRLILLLGFGFFSFLFDPDILSVYAILGFGLLLFRHWSPRWLLILAALLLLVHPLDQTIRPELPSDPEVAVEAARTPDVARFDFVQERERVAATGSLFAHWAVQARDYGRHMDPRRKGWQGSETWLLFFTMFLLGLYAGRRRIFQDIERHRVLIRRAFFWGLPLGLLAMTSDWIFRDFVPAPLPAALRFGKEVVWAYGATALALSYAAGLILLVQKPRWQRMLSPLGAMGRMALTVYLTQSVLITTLFMGYGFGQNQRVGPAGILGYAALIYAVQLATCVWWMKRFRFGPAEWLWRTLTYLRRQPMRLPRSERAAAKAPAGGA